MVMSWYLTLLCSTLLCSILLYAPLPSFTPPHSNPPYPSPQGFVLNNYASADPLISLARLAIGVAIVTGYPLTFTALREGVLDLVNLTQPTQRAQAFRPLTVGLLGAITAGALMLKDLGFVVSFSGAIFGAFVMFVVPALMNIKEIQRRRQVLAMANQGQCRGRGRGRGWVVGGDSGQGEGGELWLNYGILGLGTTMGVLGATISILRQLNKL